MLIGRDRRGEGKGFLYHDRGLVADKRLAIHPVGSFPRRPAWWTELRLHCSYREGGKLSKGTDTELLEAA